MLNSKKVFWILLALCVIAYLWRVYQEIQSEPLIIKNTYGETNLQGTSDTVGDLGEPSKDKQNHIWYDMRGKGLKEWKLEDHIRKVEVSVPVKEKQIVTKVETQIRKALPKETKPFDLDKFAIAVSHAETGGGKKGSAITHNNAFGIMTWDKNGKRSYKRYATLEDSYTDFKRIWRDKYGNRYPTRRHAEVWTGKDRVDNWLRIVGSYYYQ